MNRRQLMTGLVSLKLASSLSLPAIAQSKLKPIRMLLNTGASGPQAWFFLAQDRGYFADEGIDISFAPGYGAYTAAPRLMNEEFDIGYGDINSLIEVSATRPHKAPVGVFALFNASPSTIAVPANGPIKSPKDLEGKTLVGHPSDVALRTFGAFCKVNGIDQSKVKVGNFGSGFRTQLQTMLATNNVDGVFGYVSTISSAMSRDDDDQNHLLRHLSFAEHAPDLYGSTIMATRKMLSADPDSIAGIVRAVNRGIHDAITDPEAAIDAVMRRAKFSSRTSQMLRFTTTIEIEMGHKEGKRIGIGAVDEMRLQRSIELIASTNKLPRVPSQSEIFTDRFLPSLNERVRHLAG
ncbi:MAG: ABC transporter substrate-binding protein [Hyphomicrobiales bacterium]